MFRKYLIELAELLKTIPVEDAENELTKEDQELIEAIGIIAKFSARQKIWREIR